MPHWNCQSCGTRLYSAATKLKRETCPVCQGRLAPEGEPERTSRFAGGSSPEVTGQSAGPDEAGVSERQ